MLVTILVPVRGGEDALVDDRDYALVSKHSWRATYKETNLAHAVTSVDGSTVAMHRLIMGVTDPEKIVDHKNGDGLDNRRSNLRVTTRTKNLHNAPGHGIRSSKFKGVYYDSERDKWRAQVHKDGIDHRLGRFDDEEKAARAYDTAARRLFGKNAWLNFPEKT